jgi:alkylation response protein AidB-like acyl-CoA dehydrogenase
MTDNFDLDETHVLLREAVRSFAEKEIRPVARELDEKESFSVELTEKMGAMGFFGIVIPEKYGGQGLDYLAYGIICEELARVDSSQAATITAHNSLGVGPIYYFGNEEQRNSLLPGLCTGQKVWGFGLTEPHAGSDSRGTQTRAEPSGDDCWVINGSKQWITNGSCPLSAGVTVQAVTGREADGRPQLSCFIVEKGTPGFVARTMHGKLMWRASDTAELFFTDCRIPARNLLGPLGAGSRQMLQILDSGKIGIAAMGVGLAQGAYEAALSYAKERKQFGKLLASFQAIAFKLADMATKIEVARTMLYRLCRLRDAGRVITKEAAMTKLFCSEIAQEVANEAVQIHGGYGLMKEYAVERFFRDQRLLQIGEGTSEIQRLIIARQIGC